MSSIKFHYWTQSKSVERLEFDWVRLPNVPLAGLCLSHTFRLSLSPPRRPLCVVGGLGREKTKAGRVRVLRALSIFRLFLFLLGYPARASAEETYEFSGKPVNRLKLCFGKRVSSLIILPFLNNYYLSALLIVLWEKKYISVNLAEFLTRFWTDDRHDFEAKTQLCNQATDTMKTFVSSLCFLGLRFRFVLSIVPLFDHN